MIYFITELWDKYITMKKLEEILNLPESKKIIKQDVKEKATETAEPFLRDIAEFDKISQENT